MRRQHRLGALKVRVGREDDVEVSVATIDESLLQRGQLVVDRIDRIADP